MLLSYIFMSGFFACIVLSVSHTTEMTGEIFKMPNLVDLPWHQEYTTIQLLYLPTELYYM